MHHVQCRSYSNCGTGLRSSRCRESEPRIRRVSLRPRSHDRKCGPTGPVAHPDNGDEARYVEKSRTYSKGLKQDGPGLVDLPTFNKFRTAYSATGNGDLQSLGTLIGMPGSEYSKLNGPPAAFALSLAGAGS